LPKEHFTEETIARGDAAKTPARIISEYDDLKDNSVKNYNGIPPHEETIEHLYFTFEKMKLNK
jgi:hypothetical protein